MKDYMALPTGQQSLCLRLEGADATVRSETSPGSLLDDRITGHRDRDIVFWHRWFQQAFVDCEGVFLAIQAARAPRTVALRQQRQASIPPQFSSPLQ